MTRVSRADPNPRVTRTVRLQYCCAVSTACWVRPSAGRTTNDYTLQTVDRHASLHTHDRYKSQHTHTHTRTHRWARRPLLMWTRNVPNPDYVAGGSCSCLVDGLLGFLACSKKTPLYRYEPYCTCNTIRVKVGTRDTRQTTARSTYGQPRVRVRARVRVSVGRDTRQTTANLGLRLPCSNTS